MAKVLINGEEFDSTSPHHRQRAYFRHNVEIDEAGNVVAQSLNGLHIETPGNVVSGSPRFTTQSTNVATNNIVGGSVVQSVVSINGSTVNGVVMGVNGSPASQSNHQLAKILPQLHVVFKSHVVDIDWSACSLPTLRLVFEQLWKVSAVAKPEVALATAIRDFVESAARGDCSILYYFQEIHKAAEGLNGKRLWDKSDPAVRAILVVNNLI